MSVKKGFTLIELSLSLAFIAILSLTIAYIINDTVAFYRRGVVLNQINTTGTDLVDDFRTAIHNSSAKSIIDDCSLVYNNIELLGQKSLCIDDGGRNFVSINRYANIVNSNNEKIADAVPVYGAFCTGTYSYIWNSGYFFNEEPSANRVEAGVRMSEFKFNYETDIEDDGTCSKSTDGKTMTCTRFRLLKVKDESRSVCISATKQNYSAGNNMEDFVFDITGGNTVINDSPVDLLASDEENGGMAIYDFYSAKPAESVAKNSLFYTASFVLGTVQGGANVAQIGNYCATPDNYEVENFDYCSINKFNFAAQATGG